MVHESQRQVGVPWLSQTEDTALCNTGLDGS